MPEFKVDPAHPHLGGYLIGGDDATIYPDLWDMFVDQWKVKSVVDVGCGEGIALKHFRDRGCRVRGYDGIPQDDRDIKEWDFTQGAPHGIGRYDLAWCCEFVEHVEEQFMPNFLEVFAATKLVAMTHGTPGQAGYHHVNNQPAAYWKGALAQRGFRYDHHLTMQAREHAALNDNPLNHFVRSGLIFAQRQ